METVFAELRHEAICQVGICSWENETQLQVRERVSVVEFAGFIMEENDTEFVAEYGELPPVTLAAGQMNQAILNILTNAVQAAGRSGRVALRTETIGDEVIVTISDDGPGLAEGVAERIFEPFFTTKPVGQGTGLGLSIAYAVVAEGGGTIQVESVPGQGASFAVHLPVEGGRGR